MRTHALSGVLVAALALSACSGTPRPEPSPSPQPRVDDACGPLTSGDVVGQRPGWINEPLTAFSNDEHACRALWLPSRSTEAAVDRRSLRWFVPQGLAVRGDTAWVSGYDGSRTLGRRYCLLMKVSLDTGELLAWTHTVEVTGLSGTPIGCRHAGGLVLDGENLWLLQRKRLWLMDPATLGTRDMLVLDDHIFASFGTVRDGQIGLGSFNEHRRGQFVWISTEALATTGALVEDELVLERRRIPAYGQGAWWGTIGRRTGLWLTSSVTRCGVLTGPAGVARAFVPGAEGIVGQGDRLWVVSETPSKSYQEAGGRPVVAALMAYDAGSLVARGHEPDCKP